MPWYDFKCGDGHINERSFSLADDVRSIDCPDCGSIAERCVSMPMVMRANTASAAAITKAEKSAYEPDVVTSLPSAGNKRATPVTHNPLHAKLPKP